MNTNGYRTLFLPLLAAALLFFTGCQIHQDRNPATAASSAKTPPATAATASAPASTAASLPATNPAPANLTIAITAPAQAYIGRPAAFETTITNTGDAPANNVTIVDTVPPDVTVTDATDNGLLDPATNKLQWKIGDLPGKAIKKVTFKLASPAPLSAWVYAWAAGTAATPLAPVSAAAKTEIEGIPAFEMNVVAADNPILLGEMETYIITVTNRGSVTATNTKVTCTLEENEEFSSDTGVTAAAGPTSAPAPAVHAKIVAFGPLATLQPGDHAVWKLTVKTVKDGLIPFKCVVMCDQVKMPAEKTEITTIYK